MENIAPLLSIFTLTNVNLQYQQHANMNIRDFDLNVPAVSDERTLDDENQCDDERLNSIDLNKIPDYRNQCDVTNNNDDEDYVDDILSQLFSGEDVPEYDDEVGITHELGGEDDEEYDGQDGIALESGGEDDQGNIDEVGASHLNQFEAAGNNGNGSVQPAKKKRWLTEEQQNIVYCSLLRISNNGKLKRNATTDVANRFHLNIRQVQRIWKKRKGHLNEVPMKLKGGRKRIQVDIDRIPEIPLKQRTTLQSIANALKVSYSTAYRRFKEGEFRRHSNTIKPYLREENKRSRLQFCLSMLDQSALPNEPKFIDMNNVVHIDEKWFFMSQKKEKIYLHPTEDEPVRAVQNKNFISKIMFLTAVARPRYDESGNEVFSRKIGIFPFITKEPAQRRSRNREAGTMVTKPITSVTRDIMRTFLINKVIPAIKSKWPSSNAGETIYIQQDNARTHVDPGDAEFVEAASSSGYDIRLICQPPNSPDLNVLDLGFFNAIQSLQRKCCPESLEKLISDVEDAFEEYPSQKINRVFLTLQLCMKEIMKSKGSNDYRIPHIGKGRLERAGCLPRQISVDPALVESVVNHLSSQ